MTPETKAFIEAVKLPIIKYGKVVSHDDGTATQVVSNLLKIIESQDKEIERLRSGLHSIISKSHSWVIKEHGVYEAAGIHDGYRDIARKALENLK